MSRPNKQQLHGIVMHLKLYILEGMDVRISIRLFVDASIFNLWKTSI